MRPIRASQAEDYGFFDDGLDDTTLRDPATGKFVARMLWIECAETAPDAEPWMGVKYAPELMALPSGEKKPQ